MYGKDIVRKLICINNKGEEQRLTIGKTYYSFCDFIWDSYVIDELDNTATNQVVDRKYFKEICNNGGF